MELHLEEIIEAIEMVDDTSVGYYNLDTGEIVWIGDYLERDECEQIAEQVDAGNFARLPTQFDIHEYGMIRDFVESLPPGKCQSRLAKAICGKGAFRRFKDTVRRIGLEQLWYDYRDEAYRKIAVAWCQEHGLLPESDEFEME